MITFLFANRLVDSVDPEAIWTGVAIELLIEAFAIVVLVGIVVW